MRHLKTLINESVSQGQLLSLNPLLFEKVPPPLKFGLLWKYWYSKTSQNKIPKGPRMGHTYF